MTVAQPTNEDRRDDLLPYEIEGDFVVAHGHAVCSVIDPQEATSVPDDAGMAFRITVIAPNLSHTVETVDVSDDEVLGTLKAMYMMQRASNLDERDRLPPAFDSAYAIIAYLGDVIRGWDDRVAEREENAPYQTEAPEWVDE